MGNILIREKNLDAVTSATNGSAIATKLCTKFTAIFSCTVNTGAVTVTVQGSADGTTWATLKDHGANTMTKTYTAATGQDAYSFEAAMPFIRIITSTHSNSTITAWLCGSN